MRARPLSIVLLDVALILLISADIYMAHFA